ncbi:F-box only protein 9 [Venturia canescens]|uniref:F-box only protein 9 n=1 Tax=Venturia canescens TaxID=32260 RepID=UPI001C9D5356|nr:F-box only protein 9 [Venturia canescens]
MDEPGGSVGDGVESPDDQEESSSSSIIQADDTLASFREQWQKELEVSPKHNRTRHQSSMQENSLQDNGDNSSIENKAKNLFMKGIEHEQSGRLYEAIQFYKRAVQLIPDIEFRLYESTKPKNRERSEIEDRIDVGETIGNDGNDTDDDINDEDEETDLFAKLSKIVARNQCVCYPRFEQSTTHISTLPMEIVLYIVRWVVSSELDLRSLEMFSRVCRGFFISARDPEIWRLACVRVWGVNCGNYEPKYTSWREMYLHRPRLRYNGCYISKTTYIRHGENSFQDQFYRPWHLVEYYRYFRFFPEGRVLMLTSTDDAQSCVNSLKYRAPKNSSVLIGHYRLHDNCVTLVLKKQIIKGTNVTERTFRRKKREVVHDSGEQSFHVKFEIQNHHKRVNSQLTWLEYNIFTKYKNGQEGTACLSVSGRYPLCKFIRVKSYSQESEAPLQ